MITLVLQRPPKIHVMLRGSSKDDRQISANFNLEKRTRRVSNTVATIVITIGIIRVISF